MEDWADQNWGVVPDAETDKVYQDRSTGMANMLTARPERHNQGSYGYENVTNECGTVACVGGWGALANAGRVTIATDGTMTWPKSVDIVYDTSIAREAESTGAAWLGLAPCAADALFYTMSERVAVEMLRRIGAGEVGRDFGKELRWQVYRELGEDY